MNTNTGARMLSRASQTLIRQHHAPFRIPQLPQSRNLYALGLLKPFPSHTACIAPQIRYHSTTQPLQEESQSPLTDRDTQRPPTEQESTQDQAAAIAARKAEQPSYQLTFTCKACSERSSHHITKQAYHFGTTLITCPGCKNRHLISDHLKIFRDEGTTLEGIMAEKGELLRKGRLVQGKDGKEYVVEGDGDVEFYDEGKVSEVLGGGRTEGEERKGGTE